ncbi:hypothetical protein KTH81_18190 [Lachnospiraceae bacterium ASD3451]|uniref:hypothetical protein n=1 Tax=Diplocloster agilis TaxID=2850323 RepID=UPI001E013CB2|nr:hypothetical protein [Diplocloster agilis]MBU9745758.1 hypothetical protein [Diplocloster agilis]
MTEQDPYGMVAAKERELGVGSEDFRHRHQEIMELIEAAQKNGSRRRGAPRGSEQS